MRKRRDRTQRTGEESPVTGEDPALQQLVFELEPPTSKRPKRTWLPFAIAGGLLVLIGMALGVAGGYQVWGTARTANAGQEELASDFERRQDGLAGGATTTVPATSVEPVDLASDREEFAELPWVDDPVIGGGVELTAVTLPDVPDAVALAAEPKPAVGDAIGRIWIDSIGVDWFVSEGTEPWDLTRGPGHAPWSPLPGQPGNSVLSGHRTTYGSPFNRLDQVEAGDVVTIETLIGVHTYEVVGSLIVEPNDVWTVKHLDGAWLTLTTCHPEFWSYERLVVFAKLIDGPNAEAIAELYPADYSMPLAPGTEAATPLPAPTSE